MFKKFTLLSLWQLQKKITAIGHGTPIDFFSSSDYEILCSPIKEMEITKIHLHKYRVAQTGKY